MKIGKWSDGEQSEEDRDGTREESAEVMTRSRMWFLLWVGKFTCWMRLKDDRTERNWEVAWSDELSRCILESPVITNSWGVVAATERKELNSSRKERFFLEEKRSREGRWWGWTIDIEERDFRCQVDCRQRICVHWYLFCNDYISKYLPDIKSCSTQDTPHSTRLRQTDVCYSQLF